MGRGGWEVPILWASQNTCDDYDLVLLQSGKTFVLQSVVPAVVAEYLKEHPGILDNAVLLTIDASKLDCKVRFECHGGGQLTEFSHTECPLPCPSHRHPTRLLWLTFSPFPVPVTGWRDWDAAEPARYSG